jgi:hypothetical protein
MLITIGLLITYMVLSPKLYGPTAVAPPAHPPQARAGPASSRYPARLPQSPLPLPLLRLEQGWPSSTLPLPLVVAAPPPDAAPPADERLTRTTREQGAQVCRPLGADPGVGSLLLLPRRRSWVTSPAGRLLLLPRAPTV